MTRTSLDAVDEHILDQLAQEGRLSASEIGRRVGLSPAAAKRRIDRLENNGTITGYTVIIDDSKRGPFVEAYLELRFAGSTQVDDIDRAFTDIPEVIAVFTTAGDPDALARVRVRDLVHLKRVVDQVRRTGHVTGTKTLIVLGGGPIQRVTARRQQGTGWPGSGS